MQYRHGDVLIESVSVLPPQRKKLSHTILAHGEVTGHSHRIQERTNVQLFETSSDLYVEVFGDHATVTHEEHGPISLPKGFYRVWRQREYSPEEIRIVRD